MTNLLRASGVYTYSAKVAFRQETYRVREIVNRGASGALREERSKGVKKRNERDKTLLLSFLITIRAENDRHC